MDRAALAGRRAAIAADQNELAALVALAGLPKMSPRRLWSLLELGPPSVIWQRVLADRIPPSGHHRDPASNWPAQAAMVDPARILAEHRRRGISVAAFGDAEYPARLVEDPDPPAVLFSLGCASPLDRTAVAVVGTRRCTRYGREVAGELGSSLASAGIDVVSGLARGIDAAAHVGAAQRDPTRCVGVVAGGLDKVYPRSNRELWGQVAESGRLVSEWPLASSSLPWRFPARNRMIAGLSVTVVVVESAERGGSMHTVDEALRRERPVFAVPGSIRSPASAGTHRLIADGAQILVSIQALVEALAPEPRQLSIGLDEGPEAVDEPGSWLVALVGWESIGIEAAVIESGRSPAEVTLELERQIAAGVLARVGPRIERRR